MQYAIFHEDMHTEAYTYTRQTLAYPTPAIGQEADPVRPDPVRPDLAWQAGALDGDAAIPGGTFLLGGRPEDGFLFDNEKWAHPVEIAPFRIARAAVNNRQFAAFVDDGGYRRPELWDEDGWRWRTRRRAGGAGLLAAREPWLRVVGASIAGSPSRSDAAVMPCQLVRGQRLVPLGRTAPAAERGGMGGRGCSFPFGRRLDPCTRKTPLPLG